MSKASGAGVNKGPQPETPAPEDSLSEKGDRLLMNDDSEIEYDNERRARAHFPNLSLNVTPRESDEVPTFWEL